MEKQKDDFLDVVLGTEKPKALPQVADAKRLQSQSLEAVAAEMKKQTALLGQISAAIDSANRKLRSIEAGTAIIVVLGIIATVFGFKIITF